MKTVAELNAADESQALAWVEPLIERAPQIAQAVIQQRPFSDTQQLTQAIESALTNLPEEGKVTLFCAHPELAPVAAQQMTLASQSEQARLGLTDENLELRAQFQELNIQYQAKFGFPFISALALHQNAASVLAEFQQRLQADRDSEIQQALAQVIAVSSARVRENFTNAPKPASPRTLAEIISAMRAMLGGLLLLGLSLIFMFGGLKLGLGTPLRLGTGAFPFLTGLVLALMAVAICLSEIRQAKPAISPDWINAFAITAAIAVFAASADRFGLVPATFAAVFIASFPDKNLALAGKAMLGSVVALMTWVLFIEVLNLPFKAIKFF